MQWLWVIAVALAVYAAFKFLVKPFFKLITLIVLGLIVYFWIWPLLMN
ncbi:MAG: hypothetical protein KGI70_03230 [Patescibacteria group bacterium]|nr:hypothetical protein [Patescibacteria group bacterium]